MPELSHRYSLVQPAPIRVLQRITLLLGGDRSVSVVAARSHARTPLPWALTSPGSGTHWPPVFLTGISQRPAGTDQTKVTTILGVCPPPDDEFCPIPSAGTVLPALIEAELLLSLPHPPAPKGMVALVALALYCLPVSRP